MKSIISKYKLNVSVFVLIIIGSFIWSLVMLKSGFIYSYGMGFWGPNGHDGVWHIALIEGLSKGSWLMPVFSGETIKNYHLGFDLLTAVIHKLTFIPVRILYFQVIPPILATFTGIFVYKFVYVWKRSKVQAFWATFFTYFGGSFGWFITYLRNRELGGESMFWSQQSVSALINPPFALSLVIVFLSLTFLITGLRSNNKKYLVSATFLFGILVQIKVYAGILVVISLFLGGVWYLIRRSGISLIKVAVGALVLSILFFSPISKDSGSVIVFKPFWFLETMMGLSDRLNWPKFYQAMITYRYGHLWIKAIAAYVVAFGIFILGNFGTRFLGFIWYVKKFKKIKEIGYMDIIMVSVISAGIITPILFLQNGTPWNTIQFFYYSLIFSGILAGIVFGEFLEKSKLNTSIIYITQVLVILFTIPTTLGTLFYNYLPNRPPAKLSNYEIQALNFLSSQPDGVVLTYPFDKIAALKAENNPPRPLYLYESTAYVSAYSAKPTFLEDEVNLDITGYDWKTRKEKVENFLNSLDHKYVYDFLRNNNISYVYWLKGQRARLGETQLGMTKIFENKEVDIYRVEE